MGRKEEYKEKNLQYLQVLSTQEGICPLPCNMFAEFNLQMQQNSD